MKKALITGIAGQDGSYLTEHLLSLGYEVFGIVRRHSVAENQNHRLVGNGTNGKVTNFYGDLMDYPSLARIVSEVKPDDIYNLGAMMYWILVGDNIPTAMPPKNATDSLVTRAVDADKVELPVPPHERNPRIHTLLSKQIMDCVHPEADKRPESMTVVVNRLELILDVLKDPSSMENLRVNNSTTVEE